MGWDRSWEHYQTVDLRPPPPPIPKGEPQVGRELFGIHPLILLLKFQFSKYIESSTFYIFLHLTYPVKNISFQKCPKIFTKLQHIG